MKSAAQQVSYQANNFAPRISGHEYRATSLDLPIVK